MPIPTHTVTITIATTNAQFPPGTSGPSIIQVNLLDSSGNPIAPAYDAIGNPLIAIFNNVPDGTYTMTAQSQLATGEPVPSTDINGDPVVATISAPLVVSDPPVTLAIATGITATISGSAAVQPASTIGGDGPTLPS